MKRKLLLLLSILLPLAITYSQSEAHRIITERMASMHIPGAAFLIARDGRILDEGYYGKANLELDVDVTPKSVFAIASMSKAYTAAAILFMAEKGLLDLDDPIKKYIPEAPDSWGPITIWHLLTHSSGIVEDWSLYDWNTSNELFLKTQTEAGFLNIHFKEGLKFAPGTDVAYASGTFVLGIAIERITGQPYSAYLEDNIFNALSLTETFVDHPYKIIPHRVSGYFTYDPDIVHSPVSGLGNGLLIAPIAYGRGDVGIRTTANDLLKFYNALLTNKLLHTPSWKRMFEPATLDNGDYISTGAGWMNWPLGGIAISEHSGGFRTGFSSQALLIPKDTFVVILLTNLKGTDSAHSGASFSLTKELASLYYPALASLSKRTPAPDPRPDLTGIHLDFFQAMGDQAENIHVHPQFPYTYYSKNLKASISQTASVTYLGERNVQDKSVHFFGVPIHTLRFYCLQGKKPLYTTAYLDEADKLVFMDYPETE